MSKDSKKSSPKIKKDTYPRSLSPTNKDKDFKPGDNPNKYAARKPKKPLSSKRTQADNPQKQFKIAWAEPLSVPVPINTAGLDHIVKNIPTGKVRLKDTLPSTLAYAHMDVFQAANVRTNIPAARSTNMSSKLHAQSYFKCTRKLFATMTNTQRTKVQPIKAIFHDDAEIPAHMGAAISMIGHFPTRFGNIQVKYPELQCLRWILKGLQIDPDSNLMPEFSTYVSDPLLALWRDDISKEYIDDHVRKRFQQLHDVPVPFTYIHGDVRTQGTYTLPIIEKRQDGTLSLPYDQLPAFHPNLEEIKDLYALYEQNARDYKSANQLPHHRNFTTAINRLHLHVVPDGLDQNKMRELFANCSYGYEMISNHIGAVFKMNPPPAQEVGYPAQIVSSNTRTAAEWKLPLSDSDLAYGFTYNPAEYFEFEPHYIGYSNLESEELAVTTAKADVQPFARF